MAQGRIKRDLKIMAYSHGSNQQRAKNDHPGTEDDENHHHQDDQQCDQDASAHTCAYMYGIDMILGIYPRDVRHDSMGDLMGVL